MKTLLAACMLLGALSDRARADDFWKHWGDGRAELDGYALVQPRYGEAREGTAVLIFVTEDLSDTLRVKADPGRHAPADVYPVLKLNLVRDFQTGVYDYNIMSSTFARIPSAEGAGAAFPAVKTSFSAQEWCGHVYQQWLVRGGRMTGVVHSYFDGEADAELALDLPAGGILEEQVPILVRALRGDWLAPGDTRKVPFLPSSLRARLEHKRQAWGEATVRRSVAAEPVGTALGALRAQVYTVEEKGGSTTTWTVEEAYPHRILAWQSSSGESARILGSARLPYWQLHGQGQEAQLKLLGLEAPRPPRASIKAR